jgi:hypothetical protein
MAPNKVARGSIWVAFAGAALLVGAVPSPQGRAVDSAERAGLEGHSDAGMAHVLSGLVLAPDGFPAEGAVVVSSAGGKAVTDVAGSYRLEVEVPPVATSVQVTAVSSGERTLVASSSVALDGMARVIRVDPLELTREESCSPGWLPTFGGEAGTNDWINALAVYDDGTGPALYVGGAFTAAGGAPARYIARWDGSGWSEVGSGVNYGVLALAVFDDGGGPALYAGGSFTTAGGGRARYIAKWNGSRWSGLGSGMNSSVFCLEVFDDGGGPALYAGGNFLIAGGVQSVNHIAKWDGARWSRLAGGVGSLVRALAVYDDGGGPALYAGGEFRTASGVRAEGIAKWDGTSWSALGSGVFGTVQALAAHDDGSGPALYVGGTFPTADGVRVNHIARWNGSTWSALANGMGNAEHQAISALTVYDDGGGPELYAGGSIGGHIKRWDGSSWSAPGRGVNSSVQDMAVFDDGDGPALYAGGFFTAASGVPATRIAKWDGSGWSALGPGMFPYMTALAVYDDGGGPALYAGGDFPVAGGVPANRIAKWDGSRWSALGSGVRETVRALAVYDDGGGPALYAGGEFDLGGVAIARWDGSSWSTLGRGTLGPVRALAVYDDGGGPALYAGGRFATAGGVAANHIARWDGSGWSALGSGMNDDVWALTVYDDGRGPALYAGGHFTTAGGGSANHLARWDGLRWSALAEGVDDDSYSTSVNVHALAVYDDGGGPALFAAGFFATAGGEPARHIAKWDGSRWSALGSGVEILGYPSTRVYSLAVYDDGAGPALYAGGHFTAAGGVAVNSIARWDGSSWAPLGRGVSSPVRTFVVFDGPERGGPALIAGGEFTCAFDSGDSYLARWQGCPDTTPPVLSCPGSVAVADPLSSPPGEIVTFAVTASDERDASPSVVCEPPSGSLFPPGVTLVQCKAQDGARNATSCSFPVFVQRK